MKQIKVTLAKLGAFFLRRYGAEALVKVQSAAYAKGKKSPAYKTVMAMSTKLGKIAKMIGETGADGEFSEEEKAKAHATWSEALEDLAKLLDEVSK